MIALAIELSSVAGSVALFRDGQVIAERSWREKYVRAQQVFRALPEMLEETHLTVDAIGAFLVGRGPGSYSGLRVAITAARVMALPGNSLVYTVSSGEALALEVARDMKDGNIAIMGDARRETLWLGMFEVKDRQVTCTLPWAVVAIGDVASRLPAGSVIASPDWTRLEPALSGLGIRGVQQERFPQARYVGELALAKWKAGLPSEPLVPIYVHPAVGATTPLGA